MRSEVLTQVPAAEWERIFILFPDAAWRYIPPLFG